MTSVIVVDDDDDVRSAVGRELEERGFEVRVASSVEGALALIEAEPPEVLLTDLRMAGQDGIDLLRQARLRAPHTRTVLMSAYATARDHQHAVADGAVRVLCKPFTPDELIEAIQQAVECETGFRGSVHGLSLVDLLQMFHYARRSVRIQLGAPRLGEIHVQNGEVVHAACGDATGTSALQSLLASGAGSLQTAPLSEPVRRTIEVPFQALLLDLLRQVDEEGRSLEPEAGFELFPAEPEDDPFDRRSDLFLSLDAQLRALVPTADVVLVDVRAGRADALAGRPMPASELVAALSALRARLDAFDPAWTRFEHSSAHVGFALFRTGVGDHVLFVSDAFVGRYAQIKFRSQLVRVAGLL